MKMSRRSFLAGVAAATAATVLPSRQAVAKAKPGTLATIIDLTKCDGCPDRDTPACITSCRSTNAQKFPEPNPDKIKDYWPQPKHEDWSNKRGLTNRFTPYNWTFVQTVKVEHEGSTVEVNVPRRCMHCDSPACVKLCPFGVAKKDTDGPVHIDPSLCFGGAKCRTVCPWNVPQRQAGVGVYTYLQPMPVGGGVMYKCDLCRDELAKGELPSCLKACPQKAISIGTRDAIMAEVERRETEEGLYVYGREENGGTSTLYLSAVPFDKIDEAVMAQYAKMEEKSGKKNPLKVRLHRPDNMLERHSSLASAVLVAPIAGAVGAFVATSTKKSNTESGKTGTKEESHGE